MKLAGVAIALLLLVLAPACAGAGSAKDISIALRITVWPKGRGTEPSYVWTLRCNPLGGTLPHGNRACFRLATDRDPFAPVPKDAGCAQVYGGPAIAFVRGRLRGRAVKQFFERTDGCQIARWERVAYLFPT
ncbi:MAG: hypothetical protein ABR521_11005 [Gaiellaceae bacterium]